MIGAQAYYRNCGFVDFIEEVKGGKMKQVLQSAAGTAIALVVLNTLAYIAGFDITVTISSLP